MTPCECGFCKYIREVITPQLVASKKGSAELERLQAMPPHEPISMHDMALLAIEMVQAMVDRIGAGEKPEPEELEAVDMFLSVCEEISKHGKPPYTTW